MPTNDERREVAARLRSYMPYASQKDDASEDSIVNGNVMFRNIAQAVGGGCANLTDTYEETLIKLADLIEPEQERTCRYEPTNRCTHACTSCGREVETLHLWYNYCPNCGDKVAD